MKLRHLGLAWPSTERSLVRDIWFGRSEKIDRPRHQSQRAGSPLRIVRHLPGRTYRAAGSPLRLVRHLPGSTYQAAPTRHLPGWRWSTFSGAAANRPARIAATRRPCGCKSSGTYGGGHVRRARTPCGCQSSGTYGGGGRRRRMAATPPSRCQSSGTHGGTYGGYGGRAFTVTHVRWPHVRWLAPPNSRHPTTRVPSSSGAARRAAQAPQEPPQ